MKRKKHSGTFISTVQLEGGLFVPDVLEKILVGEFSYQTPKDYGVAKGLLSDAFGHAFQLAKAHYAVMTTRISQKMDTEHAVFEFIRGLFTDSLHFDGVEDAQYIDIGERGYPVRLGYAKNSYAVPLVVAAKNIDFPDEKFAPRGSGRRKVSPHSLIQEFLNRADSNFESRHGIKVLNWGIVTDGEKLRLVRSSTSIARPCWLEFDLGRILNEERYPDFAALFRVLHSSRVAKTDEANKHIWQLWQDEGEEQGVRVREGLRTGVAEALLLLGTGFIAHKTQQTQEQTRREICDRLKNGSLDVGEYFQQLLRLVYRLLFLFTLEERGLLHTRDANSEAKKIYLDGYSMRRLRERCLNSISDRHSDIWECAKVVFRALSSGEPLLGLPAVGGIFAPDQCKDIEALSIENSVFMKVMSYLRWSRINDNFSPIDYRNMGVEELGSVYESLLEYVPQIDTERLEFTFSKAAGNARKTSGSYYTPDSLVQELLKSALDPVIEEAHRAKKSILDIKVIDPACGSGHFLLGAARRLAEERALQAVAHRAVTQRVSLDEDGDTVVLPQNYRQALRDVISHCIYGVDLNPLAVELCRMSLWLESFDPSQPLSFIDHHLVCGNSLLGLINGEPLKLGIPDDAFSALSGDDKEICKSLKKGNKAAREKIRAIFREKNAQLLIDFDFRRSSIRSLAEIIEEMPEKTLDDIKRKQTEHDALIQKLKKEPVHKMANLYLAAFLSPKTQNCNTITSGDIYLQMTSSDARLINEETLRFADEICEQNKVMHWWLTFPIVMEQGGFDCVLGNPPWERIKLQEQEFFAARCPDIANAKNKAERDIKIKKLRDGDAPDRKIYDEFISSKQSAEAASVFAHVDGKDGGRYPLTGTGDVNTYALFAETFINLKSKRGRAGIIVPSGIATDDSTKSFFSSLVKKNDIVSLFNFENRQKLFPEVDSRTTFALLTTGKPDKNATFAFFLQNVGQLCEEDRKFSLSSDDFALFNPNTLTCPVFRSKYDAELTKKIYSNVPILIRDAHGGTPEINPWNIKFMRLLDMSNDSKLFKDSPTGDDGNVRLPLYEAKMIHHFDHRWATYIEESGKDETRDIAEAEKLDPNFEPRPRYWVDKSDVFDKLGNVFETADYPNWLMGWRDICRSTDERTVIASVLPLSGVGHNMPLFFIDKHDAKKKAAFLTNISSIVLDYIARMKVGGTHLTYFILEQLPIIPPERYTQEDLSFIVPRVLELTYTSHAMKPWAQALEYNGEPFKFDPEKRAQLRAELDAYYAKLYGLTRDELRYILDPSDVMGENCPSVTFPCLKNNELKRRGEYRTQRLVLAAWDIIEQATREE